MPGGGPAGLPPAGVKGELGPKLSCPIAVLHYVAFHDKAEPIHVPLPRMEGAQHEVRKLFSPGYRDGPPGFVGEDESHKNVLGF